MKLFFILLLCPLLGYAEPLPARQDTNLILRSIDNFLSTQSKGLPGNVKITLGQIDNRLNLASCITPEPFMPNGSRVWGKTTVGVRCTSPANWTIFVQADISVIGTYLISAAPLAQGQVVNANQLSSATGDLTKLPNGVITDASQAIGKTVAMSIPAGTPLRIDALRTPAAILQGQSVRLISTGNGFEITSEGRALNNANAGQPVQLRMVNGQVLSGIANADGSAGVGF